ncbi:MAG: hypothetical protein SOW21_04295 [[Actinobacillus] rossii]|uniref:Uncharacterized protein n=1 Tax=[Actinobacillus] rossii TaxID=123820 RepID=A0A380TSW5_9PAST|nr:hypothetical protein [[Actinobacillus] rossii]SUT91486.1 Uncharacterised protein [[Actinobacillus] rossii]SUT94242.1 Uncharacterised protein [[Actinobacillus] rossii]
MMLTKRQDMVAEIADIMQLLDDVKTTLLNDMLEDTEKLLNFAEKDIRKVKNSVKNAMN